MRRVIRLMEAMTSHASAEARDVSQSLARRRQRLSQAMVRSTIQRREFEEARQNLFVIIKPFLTRDENGTWIENEAAFDRAHM